MLKSCLPDLTTSTLPSPTGSAPLGQKSAGRRQQQTVHHLLILTHRQIVETDARIKWEIYAWSEFNKPSTGTELPEWDPSFAMPVAVWWIASNGREGV